MQIIVVNLSISSSLRKGYVHLIEVFYNMDLSFIKNLIENIKMNFLNFSFQRKHIEKEIHIHTEISCVQREILNENYEKISTAKNLILQHARVTEEARNLFWKARDDSRLGFPEEIKEYTQMLFDKMHKAYVINGTFLDSQHGLPVGEERTYHVDEHYKLIAELINEKPWEIYSKHMQI
jgi:hypothetical protein